MSDCCKCHEEVDAFLDGLVREGVTEEVTFEQILK